MASDSHKTKAQEDAAKERDREQVEKLKEVWKPPTGWRAISAVNNTVIGAYYVGAAFLFFALAGILALLMRTQLAVPDNTFISQELYNQAFTVHGTAMMFLFAVPAMEALGVVLMPQMIAARDLPFPRLSSFAIWAYIIGGTVFMGTILFGLAPAGGWFMYPPLTLTEYSPGDNADFWLLGIGFIEISAIAGAIEIVVGCLKTRAPGMSLDKMPIFAWAMLVFAGMIIFAFPAVILATLMLEIERSFNWPFFSPEGGGDPLLWQHLFWFFGHPEVYIIFLPGAALVSMIVPTMARTPLVAYNLVVVAMIAAGFFSFGLWVHHMFTTGMPALSSGFFAAASMAVAVPSGIQVFAWIATIANAKGRFRLATPGLFIIGMLIIFTLGGLTGVMVAMTPFDWQAHDSYFVVAHFHYVLIGGAVFPLFAAFYYWAPLVSRNLLSEKLGKWIFALIFIGFNVAFLPMHLTGLLGMPRRVWTYPEEAGWSALNLTSTIGAYTIAAGVALFIFDLIRRYRPGSISNNPWGAGTLEFLPMDNYGPRSIPRVASREPVWDRPELVKEVDEGRYFLPFTATGGRETLVTSPIAAEPQYVARVPSDGWPQVIAALFMAGFFLLLTVKLVWPALVCGVLAIAFILIWTWSLDQGPIKGDVDIGCGLRAPDYATGPVSHGWWAVAVLLLVAAAHYVSYFFSYLYIWTVSPEVWPATPDPTILTFPSVSALMYAGGMAAIYICSRNLGPPDARRLSTLALIAVGAGLQTAAALIEPVGLRRSGLDPTDSAFEALSYLASVLNAPLAGGAFIFACVLIARHLAGRLDAVQRASFDNFTLLYYYAAGQGLFGLLFVHGFPRIAGGGS